MSHRRTRFIRIKLSGIVYELMCVLVDNAICMQSVQSSDALLHCEVTGSDISSEAVAAQPQGPNMAAWEVFNLHSSLIAGLAAKGFDEPTPIQEACLQPAIHGRRDIIGAAQTVRYHPPTPCLR